MNETGDEDIYFINIVRPEWLPTDTKLTYLQVNGKKVNITDELGYLVVVNDSWVIIIYYIILFLVQVLLY